MPIICPTCHQSFEFREKDQKFLEKVVPVFGEKKCPIPPPTLCPGCREQRRLAFRNEKNLFRRPCGLCGKSMISVYDPEAPFKAYCGDCWFSDKWNATDYGREFDFNRPFFDQFAELMKEVPLVYNIVINSTNCEYNSFCADSKDCYLSSRLGASEQIYYSYLPMKSVGCFDCCYIYSCERCSECIDCWNCYNLFFGQNCRTTSDSMFCYDCIGCKNCFGCVGLRNKEYHFFNKPCSKSEYEEYVAKYWTGSHKNISLIREKFYSEVVLKSPHRAAYIVNSQNAVGDHIVESKDIDLGFDIEKTDTATYAWGAEYAKDLMDTNFMYYGEQCYEQISNSKSSHILFSYAAFTGCSDLLYCMICANNSKNSFGSISLNHQEYCILNKQYTKEEYEELMPRILEHMRTTGEYGEFFPAQLSFFPYNQSFAQDFYPLTKEQALERGLHWKDPEKVTGSETKPLPDRIQDVTDEILKETLYCEKTGRPYKIIEQELAFYREKNLPLPRLHPDERHRNRINARNPRKLWTRPCTECQQQVSTSFSPERPEQIYCEKCYEGKVY